MKAIRIENLRQNPQIKVAEVPVPDRKLPQEALVKVLCIGLDGTDREILVEHYGEPPEGQKDMTNGHESLGVVVEAGEESGLKPGDLVTALVRRPCHEPTCVNCRNGHSDFCETGKYVERGIKGRDGYLAEYYLEDARYLIPVPTEALEYGVLAEPQSIVEKVWDQVQRIQQRLIWEPRNALVLGSGPLGLLAAMTCRVLGLDTYVWSKSPEDSLAAELVRACGAVYKYADDGKPAGGGDAVSGKAAAAPAGANGATAANAGTHNAASADAGADKAIAAANVGSHKAAGADAGADKAIAANSGTVPGSDSEPGRAAGAADGTHAASSGSGTGTIPRSGLKAYMEGTGKRPDLVLECTGYSPLAFEAMDVLGPNGVLALLGVTPGGKKIEIPSDTLNEEMVLENKCVVGSVNAARRDFETGLWRLQQIDRQYPGLLHRIMSDRLTLEDVPKLDFGKINVKAVVDVVPAYNWREMIDAAAGVQYSFSV